MTSQSRRKRPTTVQISRRETTDRVRSKSRAWIRTLALAALPLGVGLANDAFAQQPPAWSPQPFAKSQTANAEVPVNSLRGGNAPASDISNSSNTAVARWRKIDRAEAKAPSYSQSLAPVPATESNSATNQAITASRHEQDSAPTVRRQPVTPANRIVDNAIQPASFAQPVSQRSATHEEEAQWVDRNSSRTSGVEVASNATSSRRSQGVKLANYQGESIEPPSFTLPSPSPSPNRSAAPGRLPAPQAEEELEVLPRSRDRAFTPQSPSDRQRADADARDSRYDDSPVFQNSPKRAIADCDNLRQALEDADITKIRVDSSPNFVEGYKNNGASNTKDSFVQQAGKRPWYNLAGEEIASGRLVDLAYGSVVVEQRDGTRVTYLLNRLSDADQIYVAESWGVPVTCSLNDGSFDARNFIATTMTWKASGACHKPLYFEEVQLERYGHEWGPVVQPAISSLTFVKNVAFLPYKMGIHPMNECQYSLGYYRPGSCAPWTVGPIPVSLRGAAAQAAAIGGAAWALP